MTVCKPSSPAIARRAWIFPIEAGMNDCPPKPGSTLIISTRSISGRISRSTSTEVAGLIETPTFTPALRIISIHPRGSYVAS